MNVTLRQENPGNYLAVAQMILSAYKDIGYSNHREQIMVERLRNSDAFIPQLSLVAEVDPQILVAEVAPQIVGHIMLTKIHIRSQEKSVISLCLAPLSVAPEFQGKGIGSKLVTTAHRLAKGLGYGSVTVLGPSDYYQRFGYAPMKEHGLEVPFEIRAENCMVLSLTGNGLSDIAGEVQYPSEFLE